MAVICTNCGNENNDPGGDLTSLYCGYCGARSLKRLPEDKASASEIVGSGIGAAIGAGTAGPLGALVGAAIGYLVGKWGGDE